MLPKIGLYYPYIHIRDEQWLKVAALYWPKLARVLPRDFPVADSETVRTLVDELDFIVPVEPGPTAAVVAPMFLEVIDRNAAELRDGYFVPAGEYEDSAHHAAPVPRRVDAEPTPPGLMSTWTRQVLPGWPPTFGPPIAGLYWDEVAEPLRNALFDAGLAVRIPVSRASGQSWVAMHVQLAWVYKCAFIEAQARQSGFVPTTDQPKAHLASDGWDAEAIAASLLSPEPAPAAAQEPLATMGMLALRIVIPRDIERVSVRQVVELRRRHAPEFDAFSSALDETAETLTSELAGVALPEARDQYLRLEVERRFAVPLENLRNAMKGLRIDTALSSASLKFELPAAVSSVTGGVLVGEPVIGTALGAAFAVASLRRSANQQRQGLIAASPAAYLLSVERGLAPPSLLKRITDSLPSLRRT